MSKSDDDKHKKDYINFIDECHIIADKHEEYCSTHCFKDKTNNWYPHTSKCMEFRKRHFESFVECNSILCLKINEIQNIIPSYKKEIKKEKIITELTYESDSD